MRKRQRESQREQDKNRDKSGRKIETGMAERTIVRETGV